MMFCFLQDKRKTLVAILREEIILNKYLNFLANYKV